MVKSDFLKYLSGEKNAVRDEFILSREKSNGNELVFVSHPEISKPVYSFWRAGGKEKNSNQNPKHTGGKKPYAMVMLNELVSVLGKGVPIELIGYLVALAPYAEWGTGRLVCGRKKRKMQVADIEKVFRKSRRTTLNTLSTLKKHGLLSCTDEGYFISSHLIKKGRTKK